MAVAQNGYHKSHPDLNRDLTMDSRAEMRRVAQIVQTEKRKKKSVWFPRGTTADRSLQC